MAVVARITVGHIHILDVNADPNGTAAAPKGSIASDETSALVWVNTNGASAWSLLSSGAGTFDPRDIFRFSMFHNVGVTGGG